MAWNTPGAPGTGGVLRSGLALPQCPDDRGLRDAEGIGDRLVRLPALPPPDGRFVGDQGLRTPSVRREPWRRPASRVSDDQLADELCLCGTRRTPCARGPGQWTPEGTTGSRAPEALDDVTGRPETETVEASNDLGVTGADVQAHGQLGAVGVLPDRSRCEPATRPWARQWRSGS